MCFCFFLLTLCGLSLFLHLLNAVRADIRSSASYLIEALQRKGVECEVRTLGLGDVMWIARPACASASSSSSSSSSSASASAQMDALVQNAVEIVLDCIVERKKVADLASSIIDQRYNEQKKRLNDSELTRRVYLIEGSWTSQNSLPLEALHTALAKTDSVDGLLVHHTPSVEATVEFLSELDAQLRAECAVHGPPRAPHAHTFAEFSASGRKNADHAVALTFAKQLKMVRGVSTEKCLAIARVYPTCARLMAAYEQCASVDHERALLAELKWGPNGKFLGAACATTVREFFRTTPAYA